MAFIVSSDTIGPSKIGYKNLFTDAGVIVTASSAAAGYEKENAYDWFGYDWWKPTSTGDSWIRANFGTAKLANYCTVWGHDLSDHSASVKPQYSTDGGGTWIDAASAVAPTDNNTLFFSWDDVTAADWRLLVTAATTIPVIGGVQIGEVLSLPKGMGTGFKPSSLVPIIEMKTARSESGAFIGGTKKSSGIDGSIKLSNIDPVWVRDSWIPFINHFQTPRPFVFAWDSDTHPTEVVLGWSKGIAESPVYSSTLYMDVTLEFEGIL